jgi:hypothetical protein
MQFLYCPTPMAGPAPQTPRGLVAIGELIAYNYPDAQVAEIVSRGANVIQVKDFEWDTAVREANIRGARYLELIASAVDARV